MSKFNANDCQKLKQLLSNKTLEPDINLKTNSNKKSNKRKINLTENVFKNSKQSKVIKTKFSSNNSKSDKNKNTNQLKHFSITENKLLLKPKTFGQSHGSRSKQLSEKARERLSSSQFRSINEYLYSHSSYETNKYLTKEMFDNYHNIYEKIVEKWPQKPIEYIINKIKSHVKKGKNDLTIADIGCGNIPQIKKSFPELNVHSFDLVSNDENIITADMTQLPLDNDCCDFAVFSLSLMATNIRDCISEANRILKTNGRLIIVEVLSRFDGNEDQFVETLIQFGFESKDKHPLPPNSFFIYFDFEKVKDSKKRSRLPDITLKPCFYKPR